MNKIILILNKRFSFSGKLYRFIKFIVMPLITGDKYRKLVIKDKIRINLLISNKLKTLKGIMNRIETQEDKLMAKSKRTVLDSMIVPSCKSIFKTKNITDPFLAILRKSKLGSFSK